MQRSFIWGEDDTTWKYHAIKLNVIIQPKCFEGLGIRRLGIVNEVCIMKLCRNLHYNGQTLFGVLCLEENMRGTWIPLM